MKLDPELLNAAVERQQDGVLIIELNAVNPLRPQIVYANAAFSALTGYSVMTGENAAYPIVLGPKSDRAIVLACVARIEAGKAAACQVELYRADGSTFWADVRSHPLDVPSRHCVLIFRDITERRARNEQISLLSHALEEASDFVIITDPTAATPASAPSIVYVNQSFLDATGYSRGDLLGQSGTAIYSDENDPVMMKAMLHNISLGLRNEREALVRRKDGSTFWIEVVAKPFFASEGRQYRVSIARDITLRKRAMNQMTLMLGVLETSRDRVTLYEKDRSGALVVAFENEAAASAERHRLLELLDSNDAIAEELRVLMADGGDIKRLITDRNALGGLAIFEFSAKAIGDADETILTVERRVSDVGDSVDDTASWLVGLATAMVTLSGSNRDGLRPDMLRMVLAQTFNIDVQERGEAPKPGVRIDAENRRASFSYAGTSFRASWAKPLSDVILTALRLCIEGAIAQDASSKRSHLPIPSDTSL